MRLEAWAEIAFRVVDEKGDSTDRVRLLTSDGACWQTWNAPFGDVQEWVQQAETTIKELSDDFTGQVQFVFQAESASGAVRSQCPRRVQGSQSKGRPGGGVFGGEESPSAALQKMFDAQAKTTEKLLGSANVQIEVLTRTVETISKAHGELLDYVRVKHETEALETKTDNDIKAMFGQALQQAPAFIELLIDAKRAKAGAATQGVAAAVKESVGSAVASVASTAVTEGAKALAEAVVSKTP